MISLAIETSASSAFNSLLIGEGKRDVSEFTFFNFLTDVNKTQAYKYIITKGLFKPWSRSQDNSISCIMLYFLFSLPFSSICVCKYSWDLQESLVSIHVLVSFQYPCKNCSCLAAIVQFLCPFK